jgi:nitrous oxidase accessory protein NosD
VNGGSKTTGEASLEAPLADRRSRPLLVVVVALTLELGASFGLAGASPVGAACGSFQSLVNAAAPGATITIPPCTYHEKVRVTKPLTINAAGAIIDGDNVRDVGVAILADDVTISGLTVTHVKSDAHVGAVWTTGVSRFTFRGGVARDSSTVCISLNGGTGHRVLDSELSGCAKEGYFMNGVSDTLFSGNRIHDNNTAFVWDPADEAGGGKTMASQRVTFDGNEVDHNGGPGIWFDNGVLDVSATNNRVHDNDRAGIFFEISDGARIFGNAVWNNGFGFAAWGYGAGITVSSSDRADVHDNTVAWNARGISVISQARPLQPHSGTVVHDNVVVSREGTFVAGWYDDHGDTLFNAPNANTGYGNRYWVGATEPSTDRFGWGGPKSSLAEYNATPGEEGAAYMTAAERDAALQAAGIPGIDGTPLPGTPLPTALRAAVPNLAFGAGEMAANASIPGRISWAATAGATAYQLQVQREGGAWKTLNLATPGSRSVGLAYERDGRYRARVRVKDATGAWSPWSHSTLVGTARYQETSPTIDYSGSWTRTRSLGASGAYVRFATSAGATATFGFVGQAVTWVALRGLGRGSARIYVDGVYRTTVSLYRSSTLVRSIAFVAGWSMRGPHAVTVKVIGTSRHPRIDVDAFAVLG